MPLALDDCRHDTLHVGELLDRVDTAHSQVIGAHIQDDSDINLVESQAGAQESPARSLQYRDVDGRIRENDVRRERSGHVALEHEAILQVRAVSRGEAHDILAQPEQVRDQTNGGGFSIGTGYSNNRNRRFRPRWIQQVDNRRADIPRRSFGRMSVHPDARTGVHLDDDGVVLAKRY